MVDVSSKETTNRKALDMGEIILGSEVATMSSPLTPGEGGSSEFMPTEAGTYYYICTVPGHRMQGMVGEIIVSDGSAEAATP